MRMGTRRFTRPHRSLVNPYPRAPAMAAGVAGRGNVRGGRGNVRAARRARPAYWYVFSSWQSRPAA